MRCNARTSGAGLLFFPPFLALLSFLVVEGELSLREREGVVDNIDIITDR